MQAVGVFRYGGPSALRLFETATPEAGPGEVRVRVRAATVNPVDTLIRAGLVSAAFPGPPPYIPGLDVAGTVDQIGPDTVTDLAVGDRVAALVDPTGPGGGAYAEWVVVPEQRVVHAPARTTHAEAATLPLNGLAARLALDSLALSPGQRLGVTGAAGAVGGYAVQLAEAAGLDVVADASAADRELVEELGADIVVPRGDRVADAFREVVPEGVDGVVDAAALGARVAPAVRDGGAVAVLRTVGDPVAQPASPGGSPMYKDVHVLDDDKGKDVLDTLRHQVDDGVLTLRVARTYPMERAADAHRVLERGGTRGRLVLDF